MILFFGFIFGYLTAKVFAGQKPKHSGPFGSIFIHIKRYRIHVHHWIIGLLILSMSFLIKSFSSLSFTTLDLIIYFFLLGIIAQGIIEYKDWNSIIE